MVWTLPNFLTLSRVFLIPVFFLFYLNGQIIVSFLILGYSVLTDFLDGYLARKLNQTSELGALLDPVADKFIALSYYSFMGVSGLAPLWFVSLVLVRNFSQLMAIPILSWWLKREFQVKPKNFARWGTAVSDLYIFIPLFFLPLIHARGWESFLWFPMGLIAFFEGVILCTYLPRLVQIARGRADTFT